MASIYDDLYNAQFGQPKAETGDVMRGLKQSGRQLLGTGYGIAGLAGALTGWGAAKQWGLENAQEQFDASDALGSPTDSVENIESLSDAGRFLKHGIGYVAGQAIPSIVTGGLGSIIGKKLVQEGVKATARQGIERYAATQTMAPSEKAALEQVAKAQTRGALVGSGLASYGQEAGAIYPEQIKEGHDNPWRAAGFAVPAAALDVLPEAGLVGKMFGSKVPKVLAAGEKEPGFWRRVGTGALEQAAKEAPTEAAQSVFERLGSYQALNSPEAYSDYINSALLGALGGGMFGAAGNLRGSKPIDLANIKEPSDLLKQPPPNLITKPEPMTAERLAQYLQMTEPLDEKAHAARAKDLEAAFNGPLLRTVNVPTGEVDANGQPIFTTQEVPWAMKTVQIPVLDAEGKPVVGPDGQPVLTSREVPVTGGDFIANHPALHMEHQQGTTLANDEQAWLMAMAPLLDMQRVKSEAARDAARNERLRNDEAAALRATMGLHRMAQPSPLLSLGVPEGAPFAYDPAARAQRQPGWQGAPTLLGQQPAAPAQALALPGQGVPSGQPLIVPGQGTPTSLPGSSIRDAYARAFEKQQRGELLTPFEQYLVNNPPPIALPQAAPGLYGTPNRQGELFPSAPLRQPGAVAPTEQPTASAANSLNLSLFDERGQPSYGADQSFANWQGAVRQIWTQLKARSNMIDKITALPTPEDAAAYIRDNINSTKISPSTVDAMDAAHRILTGRTIQEWETENAETKSEQPAPAAAAAPQQPEDQANPAAGAANGEDAAGAAPEGVGQNPDGEGGTAPNANGEVAAGETFDKYRAVEFARVSARAAFDQRDAYGGLELAIDSMFDNLRDTLNEHNVTDADTYDSAEAAYKDEVRKLRAKEPGGTNNLTSSQNVTPQPRTREQVAAERDALNQEIGKLYTKTGREPRKDSAARVQFDALLAKIRELESELHALNVQYVKEQQEQNKKAIDDSYDNKGPLTPEDIDRARMEYNDAYWEDGMPLWEQLSESDREQIARTFRDGKLSIAIVDDVTKGYPRTTSDTTEAKPTVADDTLQAEVDKLPAGQVNALEKAYGVPSGTSMFLSQLRADVVAYVTEGAKAVKGAIRHIIKSISAGVMSFAVVFNPMAMNHKVTYNLEAAYTKTITQTVDVRATVPQAARAKMSPLAQKVYEAMAPQAMAAGKGFIIADKPNGMLHAFNAKGELIAQAPSLYGMDTGDTFAGDSLNGGKKITPAGSFTLELVKVPEYAGGAVFALKETRFGGGYVAVHAVYLGDPKEQRQARLDSGRLDDKKISYGCINTSNETFLNKLLPNSAELNGGAIFVLPDATETTGNLFPTKTQTVTSSYTYGASENATDGTRTGGDLGRNERAAERTNDKRNVSRRRGKTEGEDTVQSVNRAQRSATTLEGVVSTLQEQIATAEGAVRDRAQQNLAANQQRLRTLKRLAAAIAGGDFKGAVAAVGDSGEIGGAHLLLLDAIARGNPKDALKAIAGNPNISRPLRMLADVMLKMQIQPGLKFTQMEPGKDGSIAGGDYGQATDTVRINTEVAFDRNNDSTLARTVLHEFVHAATLKVLSRAWRIRDQLAGREALSPSDVEFMRSAQYKAAGKLFALFDYLHSEMKRGKMPLLVDADGKPMYGMSNPVEFASEVMTDERLQQALQSIPFRTTAGRAWTAFKEFVASVANMLGIPHLKDTALTAAIEYTSESFLPRTDDTVANSEQNNVRRLRSSESSYALKKRYGTATEPGNGEALSRARTEDEFLRALEMPAEPTPHGFMAQLGGATRGVSINGWGFARRAGLAFMMMNQLDEVYGKRLPSIRAYYDATMAKGALIRKIIDSGVPVSDLWAKLTREQRHLQSVIQAQATLAEMHPDKAFDSPENKHLTVQDDPATTADNRKIWGILSDIYNNKLDDAGRALYQAELKWNNDVRNQQKRALSRVVTSEYDRQIAEARAERNDAAVQALTKERDKIVSEMGAQMAAVKGPYFPLTRAGDFVVTSLSADYKAAKATLESAQNALSKAVNAPVDNTDDAAVAAHNAAVEVAREKVRVAREREGKLKVRGEHYDVRFFTTEARAKRYAQSQRAGGMDARAVRKTVWERSTSALDQRVINQLRRGLTEKLGTEYGKRIGDAMERLLLEALPERSIRKLDVQRFGISGYEEDMGASFERHVNRMSHGIANIAMAKDINDALSNIRDEAGRSVKEDDLDVYNTILKAHAASMNFRETPLQDALVNMNYLFQLAWSPAFMLQQVLQNPMLTLPTLAAEFGFARSGKMMWQAAGEVMRMLKSSVDKGAIKSRFDYMTLAKNDDEREMFRWFHERNQLDTTINHEMDTGDGAGMTRVAMTWAAFPASWTETANRATAMLTAYRLARAPGKKQMSHEAAVRYAEQVVNDTHIGYAPENSPLAMRPGVLPFSKVIFQFRKFQLGMIYFLVKNARAALSPNSSAEERAVAAKTLFGVLAMQQIMAGAAGFPLAAPIGFIASLIAKFFYPDDDKPDFDILFRNWLVDAFGGDAKLARAVAKGLPSLFGVDLSSSIGLGNAFAPLPFVKDADKMSDRLKEYMVGMFGPTASKAIDLMDAGDLFHEGHTMKAVEKLLPRAAKGLARGYRFDTEGVTTRRGNVLVQPDELEPLQIFATAAGLSLSELSDLYDAKNYVEQYKKARADARGLLIDRMLRTPNDEDARRAVSAFNERHPEDRITGSTIAKARMAERKYQRQLDGSHVELTKRERQLAPDLRFAR